MDISEYRRQFEEELEQAARQPSFRDLVAGSRPGAESRAAVASQGSAADDALAAAIAVLGDDEADEQLRFAALQVINSAAGERPELIDTLLGVLQDTGRPAAVRIAVLDALQQITF